MLSDSPLLTRQHASMPRCHVTVAVRKRPPMEKGSQCKNIRVDLEGNLVAARPPRPRDSSAALPDKLFRFDHVFDKVCGGCVCVCVCVCVRVIGDW